MSRTEQISLLRDKGYNIVQILTGQKNKNFKLEKDERRFEGAAAIMENRNGHQVVVNGSGHVGAMN